MTIRMQRLGSGREARAVSTDPYVVLSGTPAAAGEVGFADSSGRLKAGIAIYQPCTVRLEGYPADEYCFLLEGNLEVVDDDGAVTAYEPGDAFLLPRGFRGEWRMPHGIRKYYVVFDALAGAA